MINLSKLVERGAGLSLNQENQVKELKQAREELARQDTYTYIHIYTYTNTYIHTHTYTHYY
jgi:hypothetical protein